MGRGLIGEALRQGALHNDAGAQVQRPLQLQAQTLTTPSPADALDDLGDQLHQYPRRAMANSSH